MFSEVNKTYHIVYSAVNIKCMFLFNLMSKIMEFLIEQFQQKLKYTSLTFVRSIMDDIIGGQDLYVLRERGGLVKRHYCYSILN